jgi:hypothetical protein
LIANELEIRRILRSVKADSTPGIPYSLLGQTNRQVLESSEDFVISEVVESFIRKVTPSNRGLFSWSAEQLFRRGIRDPVRLFIKDEPHKAVKITTGKLRLISGVSLVDQICERVLGQNQNNAEIAEWQTCPSKPGLGLDDDGLRALGQYFKRELNTGPLLQMDVKGWDWSVQEWELLADAEARSQLCVNSNELFSFLLKTNATCVARSVFCLPSGELLAQLDPGAQLSGSYWTSSTNSRMRILASLVARLLAGHRLTGEIGVAAMGDDSVERSFSGVKEGLESLGHTIGMENTTSELRSVSFCSHEWKEDGLAYPENPYKTVFRFLSHRGDQASFLDWYSQLSWVLRHHPDRDKFLGPCFARVERANDSQTEQSQGWQPTISSTHDDENSVQVHSERFGARWELQDGNLSR